MAGCARLSQQDSAGVVKLSDFRDGNFSADNPPPWRESAGHASLQTEEQFFGVGVGLFVEPLLNLRPTVASPAPGVSIEEGAPLFLRLSVTIACTSMLGENDSP